MKRLVSRGVLFLAIAAVASGLPGCSKRQPENETVAQVNGNAITVAELREFLGVPGDDASDAGITAVQKKEALDRLIAGRLLVEDARRQGLDNTTAYRDAVKENQQRTLITALFRKEVASKKKVSKEDVDAETKKLMAADNTLSDNVARIQARKQISQAHFRKLQEGLIDNAQKEFPVTIDEETVDKIGKKGMVPDNAVLATAAGENFTYGDAKRELEKLGKGMPGLEDILRNPVAVKRMLTREATGASLAAYAKKQGIEGSGWFKLTEEDIGRAILVDLLVQKKMEGMAAVSDKEVDAYYRENPQMFTRNGKTIPLKMVREQVRGFLQNSKRQSEMNTYIEELKKKAKITVNEKALGEV